MKSRTSMLAVVVAALLAAGQSAWAQYAPPGAGGYAYPTPPAYGPANPYAAPAMYADPGMGPPSVLAGGAGALGGPMGPALGAPMGPPMGMPPMGMGPMGPPGGPPGGGLQPIPYDAQSGKYMDEGGEGCDPSLLDGGCGPASRMWIDAEYLMWYSHGRTLPPLVTTAPIGTAQADAGVLGEPTTQILFGNGQVGEEVGNGLRFTTGFWLDRNHENCLVLRAWYLDGNESDFSQTEIGPARNNLAIPFFDTDAGVQAALLVSFRDPPFDLSEGSVSIRDNLEISSAEVLGRFALERGCGYRVDFIGGFQSQRIDNDFNMNIELVSLDPGGAVPVGTVFEISDAFSTRNHFNGGTVGLQTEWQRGPWLFKLLGKCGIGNMNQRTTISGSTTTTTPPPGPTVTVDNFGFFSRPSNIGEFEQNKMCFQPELNFTVCYQLTCHIDVTAGYSFNYWSSVAMAGDQLNTQVDPTNTTNDPSFTFRSSDFWAQGGNFGFLVHW